MSRGINKVILIGHLGSDPDMKSTPSGNAIANFSIATSENWNDKQSGERREKTEWHRVVAFGRLAEIIGQYCRKGSKVFIEGKLQTRKWTDKSNIDRYTTEIIASEIQLLDAKNDGSTTANQHQQNNYSQQQQQQGYAQARGGFNRQSVPPPQDDFNDDQIPF